MKNSSQFGDRLRNPQTAGIAKPVPDSERTAGPLGALEEAFRPLVKDLPPGLEPDWAFAPDEEGE
ncbi:MAG: hypothetical protein LAQ30_09850 [Acidobacteriia bacterium]|nr:hypothetical protein [Terriglobia bacterium]